MLKRIQNGYELEEDVELTKEQQERFNEIQNYPAGFMPDYEAYITDASMPSEFDEEGNKRNFSVHPMRDMMIDNKNKTIARITTSRLIRAAELTPEEIMQLAAFYPDWKPGKDVKVGEIYNYHGLLYEAIQAHTTQADWTPDKTASLWKPSVPDDVIPDWTQPTGAHDAYNKGDRVIYKDKIWTSKIDANTTIPDGDEPYNRYWGPES